MIRKVLPVGPIMANCYILGCEKTREAVVIDPGEDADKILMELASDSLKVKTILNTHGHFDHVGANAKLKEVTGAPILIHSADAPMLGMLSQAAASFGLSCSDSPPPDKTIADGDIISFGDGYELKVIHTPGHSPGGVSFFIDKELYVGDTVFSGSIGRTDLPGGDYQTLINSIKTRLIVLGDDVTIYPGHGPETTVSREKRYNPFLR